MKKTTKIIISILVILTYIFLLLIFIELKNINNRIPDTFYARNVYFEMENDSNSRYRMTFDIISSLEKEYKDNKLIVKFKCYDENGIMITDNLEAKIEKGEFNHGTILYTGIGQQNYKNIKYCELNYVSVY